MTTKDTSDKPKKASEPFIPAVMDDSNLPVHPYRVLNHICRRGLCWASAETIGQVCRMKRQTVFKALKLLLAHGFIIAEKRHGQTTRYKATPCATWQPVPNGDTGNPSQEGPRGAYPDGPQHPVPQTVRHPSQEGAHKGSPSEVPPSEGDQKKGEVRPRIVLPKMFPAEVNREIEDLKAAISRLQMVVNSNEPNDEQRESALFMYEKLRALETVKYGSPQTKLWQKLQTQEYTIDRITGRKIYNDRNDNANGRSTKSDYSQVGKVRTAAEQRQVGIGHIPRVDVEALVEGDIVNDARPFMTKNGFHRIGMNIVSEEEYEAAIEQWNRTHPDDQIMTERERAARLAAFAQLRKEIEQTPPPPRGER